jgi:hypothetical protein
MGRLRIKTRLAFAGANFTAGLREREDANRTRKPGAAIGNRGGG